MPIPTACISTAGMAKSSAVVIPTAPKKPVRSAVVVPGWLGLVIYSFATRTFVGPEKKRRGGDSKEMARYGGSQGSIGPGTGGLARGRRSE